MNTSFWLLTAASFACFVTAALLERPAIKIEYRYLPRDLDRCLAVPQSPYALYRSSLSDSGTRDHLRGEAGYPLAL